MGFGEDSDDESQWHDTDDDGYGDNLEYFDGETWREAWRGDGCVATEGNSAMDRWGCPDSDGVAGQTLPLTVGSRWYG